MAQQPPPLDETQFRMPEILEWHLTQGGQWLDENIIHRYISESPFFDHSTKNGLLIDQSRTNLKAFHTVGNRRAFEAELKAKKGVEYMIVGEPQPLTPDNRVAPGKANGGVGGNGMWVLRKQNRDRVQTADGRWEEALNILGTYYLVGENMYQAPSIADIISNRLTAAANSLARFYETARQMSEFDVERGYTYLPHKAPASKHQPASAAGSPHSREGSVADTRSQRSTSLGASGVAGASGAIGAIGADGVGGGAGAGEADEGKRRQDTKLLTQTFRTIFEFPDDFLDENPLVGEPGGFTYTHSTQALRKRRVEAEAEAEADAKASETSRVGAGVGAGGGLGAEGTGGADSKAGVSGKDERAAEPPAVMTEKATKERRAGKGEKGRRKKSRHSIAVGGTPGKGGPTE